MERVVFRIGLILFTQPQFFLRMCSPMNTRTPGLSRRALMSALGVSGFAVLLSACGEDSKPAGAATESSSSSSSATVVASASSSDSPSPSSSVSPHYSGNSKAPDGEFRAADVYGPAQNVPKPKTEEEGYTNASLEGMRKTVQAWTEWRNYGLQTGDFKEARKFLSKDFKDEDDTYSYDADLYKDGGWIIGGDEHKYEFHGEPINQGNGKYEWKFFLVWPYIIHVAPDKTYKKTLNKNYEDNWYTLSLHHDGNRWLIDGVAPIKSEKK